jgi:hypothetical protein
VPSDVVQRFLRNPKKTECYFLGQHGREALLKKCDLDLTVFREFVAKAFNSNCQSEMIKFGRV